MWAPAPAVLRSTATPGMKWSTVLVTGSIGMRCTADHVVRVVEETQPTSLGLPALGQPARKRQSPHPTKIRPSPAISAEGSGPLRISPGSGAAEIDVITSALPNRTPPLVEIV